jgi:hypothetical protein
VFSECGYSWHERFTFLLIISINIALICINIWRDVMSGIREAPATAYICYHKCRLSGRTRFVFPIMQRTAFCSYQVCMFLLISLHISSYKQFRNNQLKQISHDLLFQLLERWEAVSARLSDNVNYNKYFFYTMHLCQDTFYVFKLHQTAQTRPNEALNGL